MRIKEELSMIFKNTADCYADIWIVNKRDKLQEGEVIQAMTEAMFIKEVTKLLKSKKSKNLNKPLITKYKKNK